MRNADPEPWAHYVGALLVLAMLSAAAALTTSEPSDPEPTASETLAMP